MSRAGVSTRDVTLGFGAGDAGVEENLRETAEALRQAGATVQEVDLGWHAKIHDMWYRTGSIFMAAAYDNTTQVPLDENRHRMSKRIVEISEMGHKDRRSDGSQMGV